MSLDGRERFAVLGGGPAGLAFCAQLAEHGSVTLFERSSSLGGLQRSVETAGRVFDIGAFLFSPRHELITSFPFLADDMVAAPCPRVSLTPSGRLDVYPLSLRGFARDHGLTGVVRAYGDALRWRAQRDPPANARDALCQKVGAFMYEQSGLANYVERLYGLPDCDVDATFVEQRMPNLPRLSARRFVSTPARRARRRVTRARTRRPRTGQPWARPVYGFAPMFERVGEHLRQRDVDIRLGTRVERVSRSSEGFIVDSGPSERFDHVISSIPIPVMLRLLGLTPRAHLETLSLMSLFFVGTVRADATVIYNFTSDARWKRMHVFSRFYGQKDGLDYWVVEVTTRATGDEDIRAATEETLRHLVSSGLVVDTPTCVGTEITPNAYPVFRVGDNARAEAERARLEAYGIVLTGRQGRFEYLFSSDAIARARRQAVELG